MVPSHQFSSTLKNHGVFLMNGKKHAEKSFLLLSCLLVPMITFVLRDIEYLLLFFDLGHLQGNRTHYY
jgi:hypothetical protein